MHQVYQIWNLAVIDGIKYGIWLFSEQLVTYPARVCFRGWWTHSVRQNNTRELANNRRRAQTSRKRLMGGCAINRCLESEENNTNNNNKKTGRQAP